MFWPEPRRHVARLNVHFCHARRQAAASRLLVSTAWLVLWRERDYTVKKRTGVGWEREKLVSREGEELRGRRKKALLLYAYVSGT